MEAIKLLEFRPQENDVGILNYAWELQIVGKRSYEL